jgi:hypothetical protein
MRSERSTTAFCIGYAHFRRCQHELVKHLSKMPKLYGMEALNLTTEGERVEAEECQFPALPMLGTFLRKS